MLLDAKCTIGQRFKHIRTEKGVSQAQLVEGICSIAVVSQIECDRKYPSAELLGKLADKLGVPLREIMGMQEKQMEAGFQIDMVRVYIEKADHTHALEIIDELDQRSDLLVHQKNELLICRAECYRTARIFDKVVEILVPFLQNQQTQQNIEDEVLCDTYNKLGNAHYWLNDFEKAYSAFEQGYRISLRLHEYGVISARVTKNLGLTCLQIGYKEDARLYLEKAHAFFEGVSDMKEVANTLFDMARVTGNPEYMVKARSIYEGLNLVREANLAKQHYAFHVEAKKDYKKAVAELRATAGEFDSIGDFGMSLYIFSRAIKVCLDNDDLIDAKSCLAEAEQRKEKMASENPLMIGAFFKARSEYNYQMKRFDECLIDSEKSSALCAIMGMFFESADSLQISAKVHELRGEFQKAYEVTNKVVDFMRQAQRR